MSDESVLLNLNWSLQQLSLIEDVRYRRAEAESEYDMQFEYATEPDIFEHLKVWFISGIVLMILNIIASNFISFIDDFWYGVFLFIYNLTDAYIISGLIGVILVPTLFYAILAAATWYLVAKLMYKRSEKKDRALRESTIDKHEEYIGQFNSEIDLLEDELYNNTVAPVEYLSIPQVSVIVEAFELHYAHNLEEAIVYYKRKLAEDKKFQEQLATYQNIVETEGEKTRMHNERLNEELSEKLIENQNSNTDRVVQEAKGIRREIEWHNKWND